MTTIKPSSRYSTMESRSSSSTYDPLSSSSSSASSNKQTFPNSNALIRAKIAPPQGTHNLGSLLKKLVDKRANKKDLISKETKKGGGSNLLITNEMKKGGGSNLSALSRKLFQKGGEQKKVLTEMKSNTRTLAMVLRSERELLNKNTEYEDEISQLRFALEERNIEVEKLKDLCSRQREEIKALKEQSNRRELEETVSSLMAQIRSLSIDLAQVKAEKYNEMTSMLNDHAEETTSPSVATHEEISEYGSSEIEVFLKDFNPCLTPPFSKQFSKDSHSDGFESPSEGIVSNLCGRLELFMANENEKDI